MNKRSWALFSLLAALALLRWWTPLDSSSPEHESIAEPTQRRAAYNDQTSRHGLEQQPTTQAAISHPPLMGPSPQWNAFETRGVPSFIEGAPPPPTRTLRRRPPPVLVSTQTEAPQEEDPEAQSPPPPLAVIGTWMDGQKLSVFVSTPNGTALASTGDTLMGEYKILKITSREVLLSQLKDHREWPLSIPQAAMR